MPKIILSVIIYEFDIFSLVTETINGKLLVEKPRSE